MYSAGNKDSCPLTVLEDVPQSSIFGLSLFLTHINNLPTAINYETFDLDLNKA